MSSLVGVIFFVLALHADLSTANLRLSPLGGLQCNEAAMNPHPEDCHKYIICAQNSDGSYMGAISECGHGEAFSKEVRACVPASEVNCRRRFARETAPNDTNPTPVSCDGKPILCADCNTLRICRATSSGFSHLQDLKCNDGNKETYCDSTIPSCTDKIPENCDSGYQCTGLGFFPDPSDCTFYHYCYESPSGSSAATSDYCASGQVYSTSQKICVNRVRPTDCHVATCPANKTLITDFPGEPSYYVVCVLGKPQFVYRCGENEEFNTTKKSCEVKCKEAIRIPNSSNCMAYYECTANRVGGGFTATAKMCPTNTVFDPVNRVCIPGKCS